ncbi:SPOR domain-containing protein [Chloracidobacterium validum]|uniref:SPOR domain-containing protein n=1 Tax=Chloracidobacterium validum TaxID=2821543 RepID=A0ABX8B5V2_9BACT|nr:SPOR domain-containing protein [Chloracidobacterium validum]QUW02351.1 SPOR domain-containing protein [Chloracidobacterium validum]
MRSSSPSSLPRPSDPLPPRRLRPVVIGYAIWVASCTVFFALGVNVGKLSPFASLTKRSPAPAAMPLEQPIEHAIVLPDARYAVQVAAVATADEANRLVAELNRKGFTSAFVTRPTPEAENELYLVKVGLYNLATANQVSEELRRDFGFRSARVVQN